MNVNSIPMGEHNIDPITHPLINGYEKKLSGLIGNLSQYIVTRQFSMISSQLIDDLDKTRASEMINGIVEEAIGLIGPNRASKLQNELITITTKYFKEE